HRPPPALGELVREGDVLAASGLEGDVGLPAQRVDRAVSRGDAGQARLEPAHGHLIAPVEALLVVSALALQPTLAADVAGGGPSPGWWPPRRGRQRSARRSAAARRLRWRLRPAAPEAGPGPRARADNRRARRRAGRPRPRTPPPGRSPAKPLIERKG